MHKLERDAPKAVGAAKGADIACVEAIATGAAYPTTRRPFKRRVIEARGAAGAFTVTGQTAKALEALVERGAAGVTSLEVSSWALRLSAYVHDLRHDYGLTIETVREDHEGGWHARYRLASPVTIERRSA